MIKRIQGIVEKEKRLAVGLMSGTSLDGIDAALVEIAGSGIGTRVNLIGFYTLPYDEREKAALLKLCSTTGSSVDGLCRMNAYLGGKMAQAALEVIGRSGLKPREIDFVSSHGQTVYHMPEEHATLQIGDIAYIAAQTGCVAIGDFRPGDMAAGGQGAPLVPYVDYLLFRNPHAGRALINIGGMGNVTVIKKDAQPSDVTAFDTGPGNVLIDAVVRTGTGGKRCFDEGGLLAAGGNVCSRWLEELIGRDAFLRRQPPKSTGREYYGVEFAQGIWREGIARGLRFEDIVATVTAYTVSSIKWHFDNYIDKEASIDEVFVGGGGTGNKTLMAGLEKALNRRTSPMEALGFSSDAKEAVAFAVLGNEFLFGRPNNLPSATGASRPVIMGKLALP